MKTIKIAFAAAAFAALTSGPALAADSCKDEIARVEKELAGHFHEAFTSSGSNQQWETVGQAVEHAKKDCAAGKEKEAFETINFVSRAIGGKEHLKH